MEKAVFDAGALQTKDSFLGTHTLFAFLTPLKSEGLQLAGMRV